MKRDDFVCGCGAPLEPSEIHIDPPVRETDGLAHYVGVCCVPDCDASEVICALDNGTSLPDVPPPDEDEDEDEDEE